MAQQLRRHPLAAVVLIEVLYVALVIAGSLGLNALMPGLPGYSVTGPSQSLVLVLASAGLLMILVGALGWWTLAGFTSPARWRDLRLYWLPVVLLVCGIILLRRTPTDKSLAREDDSSSAAQAVPATPRVASAGRG